MELDKNFLDSLTGLVVAALRKDSDDIKECVAYVAQRLESYGAPDYANRWRGFMGDYNFIDGVWAPTWWSDDWRYLADDDRVYSLYETQRVAERRNLLAAPSILTSEQGAMVEEILRVGKSRLTEPNPSSTSILIYGTAVREPVDLALYIARQLEFECLLVEFRDGVEQRVGCWAGQLHRLCQMAANTPCVLFLQGLEKICGTDYIEDSWRVESLKCTRDRFLKNLSMLKVPTVVVACTNFEMKLDSEVWDRFGYRMELNDAEPDPRLLISRAGYSGGLEGMADAMDSLHAEGRLNWTPSMNSDE